MALPPAALVGIGLGTAGLNIASNLFGRNRFDDLERNIRNIFTQRIESGKSRIAADTRARVGRSGLGGSGILSSLINDLQQNFALAEEQQRDQSLFNLEFQRRQSEPSTAEIIAGGIGSGLQSAFNIGALSGSFDNLLRSTPQFTFQGGIQGFGTPGTFGAGTNPFGVGIGAGVNPGAVPEFVSNFSLR